MGKVILNLCLNALEASTAGQSVSVTVGDEPEPFVRVTDHGVPRSSWRAGSLNLSSHKAKGMGIGLYQCKQIVEAHGGRIEVRSAPDEGSEFIVCIGDRQGL